MHLRFSLLSIATALLLIAVEKVTPACKADKFSNACMSQLSELKKTYSKGTADEKSIFCYNLYLVLECVIETGCEDKDPVLVAANWQQQRAVILQDCPPLKKPPSSVFGPAKCIPAGIYNCTVRDFHNFDSVFSGTFTTQSLEIACRNLVDASYCVLNTAHCTDTDPNSISWINRRNVFKYICDNRPDFITSQQCFQAKAYLTPISDNCPAVTSFPPDCTALNKKLACDNKIVTQYCNAAAAKIYVGIERLTFQADIQVALQLTSSAAQALKSCSLTGF